MSKTRIIKRDGKFYKQEVDETEVTLQELKDTLVEYAKLKGEAIKKEKGRWDSRMTHIQSEINELKAL